MKVYVFPGQGSQFEGMGKDLYENSELAKSYFDKANKILGFDIKEIMFDGTKEELQQTKVTQPAIFLHSVILALVNKDKIQPNYVAGHSLGEFSALVIAGVLDFESALLLVSKRAMAMQKACENTPSTMAAILGLENEEVEIICKQIDGIVVPANYNSPGQIVISGELNAIEEACNLLLEKGAKRAIKLPVGGAFHSPLMQSAQDELSKAIDDTVFNVPKFPVIQNFVANPVSDINELKQNLKSQLTGAVKWTQSMEKMIELGVTELIEVGPGNVLQGLMKKIDRKFTTSSL